MDGDAEDPLSEDLHSSDKAQVFISYTSDDRALVASFIQRLCDQAIKVAAVMWYDRKLTPSEDWDREVMARLSDADIVLVLASPKFFESQYCVERELPVIRERLTQGQSAVRAIRLREFDNPRPELEGIPIWPENGHTVQTSADSTREWGELRTWMKVEVCKALVARNADRYHGLSRAENLKLRAENAPFDVFPAHDDLSALHESLGVPATSPVRLAAGMIGGLLMGATAGVASKALLVPGAMASVFSPVVLFATLGFVAGCVGPCFRAIELLVEDLCTARRPGVRFWQEQWLSFTQLLPVLLVAGLAHAVVLAAVIGLPLGVVLSLRGGSLDLGLSGAAIAGGIIGALAGRAFAASFTPRRLKVFTDVRHLYRPPNVEAMPPLPLLSESLSRRAEKRPVAQPLPARDAIPEPVVADQRDSVPPARDVFPPAQDGLPPAEDAIQTGQPSLKRGDVYLDLKSVADVPGRLIVVSASARPEETARLLAALAAEYCDDLFVIETCTDADPRSLEVEYWKDMLDRPGNCLVLMTAELMQSRVPEALALAAALHFPDERRMIYPILVDRDLPPDAPLMALQGLPTGQLAIRDWPIPENAWINVARVLFKENIRGFLIHLNFYLERSMVAELEARLDLGASPHDRYSAVRSRERDLMGGEVFVDPRHELSRYPFEHAAIYRSWKQAVWWTVAGAIGVGSIGHEIAATWGAQYQSMRYVLPPCALVLAVAYLGLRDTLSYARKRLPDAGNTHEFLTVPGLLLEAAFHDDKGRYVLRWTASVLIKPLALIGCVTAGIVAGEVLMGLPILDSARRAYAIGAATGLGCYLLSRYRVPAIVAARGRPIPTPYSDSVVGQGWKWTLRMPRENRLEIARGRIGQNRSPLPRLIEGHSEQLTLSAGMIVRGLVDALWITALLCAIVYGTMRAGISAGVAIPLSLYVAGVPIQWLRVRHTRWRFEGEPLARAIWREYGKPMWLPALHTAMLLGIAMVAAALLGYVFWKDSPRVAVVAILSAPFTAIFCMRLRDQVLISSRARYADRRDDPS